MLNKKIFFFFFFNIVLILTLIILQVTTSPLKRRIHEFADGLTDILVFEKKLLEYYRIIMIA